MGSSVFAPDDEYGDPAHLRVFAATSVADLPHLVRTHFPTATDQIV